MSATLKIVFLCLSMAIVTVSCGKLPLIGQQKLMQFMVQSRDVSHENPARSLNCFDYYVPILNGITEEFEKSYGLCLQSADDARSLIDESTQPDRDDIESKADNACEVLKKCTSNTGSIDYFECYVQTASDNTKVMYNISATASDILAVVREQYRLIENEQNRCTNASERVYVQDTASTYEELQCCLMGLCSVPSNPPTTTPGPTDEPTTTPPPTDGPTTTPGPTDEPTTTPPPTDEPTTTPPPTDEPTTTPEIIESSESTTTADPSGTTTLPWNP